MADLVQEQKPPTSNDHPAVWPLVIEDLRRQALDVRTLVRMINVATDRDELGRAKYGTPLQPFNGRDPVVDAYQETIDKVVYLRQAVVEQPDDTELKELYREALYAWIRLDLYLARRNAR